MSIKHRPHAMTRREMLRHASMGFGQIALAGMLHEQARAEKRPLALVPLGQVCRTSRRKPGV